MGALNTPERMLESMRDWLDVRNENYWTYNLLMQRLHDAQQEIVRQISNESPSFFWTEYDVNLVAGQSLYALPRNARLGTRWLAAENHVSGTPYYYLFDVDMRRHLYAGGSWPWTNQSSSHVTLQGPHLRVVPPPGANVPGGLRLGYVCQHGNMIQRPGTGTVTATAFSLAGGESDCVRRYGRLDPRDGYYDGMTAYVVSGTGAGQERIISQWHGASRTATIAAAWTSTPTASSVFSFQCPVPEDFTDVVCLRGAMLAAAKGTRQSRTLDPVYFGAPGRPGRWHEMMAWVGKRQDFTSPTVEPFGSAF